MNLEKYLVPISEESPCGEDLEDLDDMKFYELENLVPVSHEMGMFDNEEEVDWSDITEKSLALLERSKDIRTVLYLAQAQLNLKGLNGFFETIDLLVKLTIDNWQSIYPLLDSDDGDPIERVNALKILGDSNSILNVLRKVPIAESKGFGRICFRDCELANGNITSGDEAVELSHIHAVFMDTEKEYLLDKIEQLSQMIELLKSFDVFLLETIPGDAPTEIKELVKVLAAMLKSIDVHAQDRDDWSIDTDNSDLDISQRNDTGSTTHSPAAMIQKGINNRSDVINGIDDICKYYEKNEPSSPVPLLLQRAKRLVDKDFMEIIRDMAGDALSEVKTITGVKDEDDY